MFSRRFSDAETHVLTRMPVKNADLKNSPTMSKWTERLIWVLVLLVCALTLSPNVADPDLWGHVQYGRDVLADKEIPATTSYSYTAEDFRWINHENLSEIVMAITADSFGPIGLMAGKMLLGMMIIGLIIVANHRAKVGLIANSAIALLVATNLAYHFSVRPQLSSFICFAILLALIQFCFAGWRDHWHLRWPGKWFDSSANDSPNELGYDSRNMRFLWLAAPIFLIWGNSHGGFVAGLCIFGLYLACRAFEALNRRGLRGWGLVRRMMLMGVVAILATLINPYGFKLHAWLFESLGQPRPEILDWKNYQLFTVVGAKFWLLLATVVFSLALTRRRLDWTQLVVLAIVLWQSVSHFRHVPFFAILAGYWIAPHLQSAIERVTASAKSMQPSVIFERIAIVGLSLSICVVGFRLMQRLTDLRVERDTFPVSAFQFMHDHDIRGRMVVTYNWAQYAIAAFCVEDNSSNAISRVGFDGRFRTAYPQPIVDMHFDFLYGNRPIARFRSQESSTIDPGRVLELGSPEIILLARFGEYSEQNMSEFTDRWTLLYQDNIAQVWGIKRRFDDPNSPDYLPVDQRQLDAIAQQGSATWPALPIETDSAAFNVNYQHKSD